jgi:hypothetical protein
MINLKVTLIRVLLGLAAVLGSALFFVWKLYSHEKELKNAHKFLKEAPEETKKKVLNGLEIKAQGTNAKAWELREEIEKSTKEEIVYAFEKAFGVGSHHTGKYLNTGKRADDDR